MANSTRKPFPQRGLAASGIEVAPALLASFAMEPAKTAQTKTGHPQDQTRRERLGQPPVREVNALLTPID